MRNIWNFLMVMNHPSCSCLILQNIIIILPYFFSCNIPNFDFRKSPVFQLNAWIYPRHGLNLGIKYIEILKFFFNWKHKIHRNNKISLILIANQFTPILPNDTLFQTVTSNEKNISRMRQ